jgi:hypothetical protein
MVDTLPADLEGTLPTVAAIEAELAAGPGDAEAAGGPDRRDGRGRDADQQATRRGGRRWFARRPSGNGRQPDGCGRMPDNVSGAATDCAGLALARGVQYGRGCGHVLSFPASS